MSRDLVERAMHGDQEAFGMLAERSLDRLVGTAGLILRDADAGLVLGTMRSAAPR